MYASIKRILDSTLALLAILVLLPLLLPVCAILFCTGEHQVFYFQERIGYHNRRFRIWKFTTMMKSSSNMAGGFHTTRRDPRVLPFGRFLRRTKINELPQVVNVLLGDMALVGPRPLVDKTFDPYPPHVKARIYDVRPGLTGIGSIVFRDEERLLSECGMPPEVFYREHISPAKGELELWYQRHMGPWTDLRLLFLTAWVILFPASRLLERLFRDLPAVDVPGLTFGCSGRAKA
jgi:lipopolysaccharide/colanic/teichoic acid biosynthesis glycosyltransferase